MKCLIIGATGNIGSRVAARLIARGERPRVFARDAKKAKALFGERVDLHVGDLDEPRASLPAALEDIDEVFLVTDGPELDQRDRTVANAAKSAGVRRVVKLSTLDVHNGVGTGPWHARGERAVRESGVAYTFVQPAGFMLNAYGWAHSIRERGVLRSSTGQGTIALIHPDDIADVATAALLSREYDGQSLVITGPEALSYGAMAAIVGAVIAKRVRYEEITDQQAYASVIRWAGKGPYADALVDIWRAVREGRLATVTDGVQRVLSRAPLSFERWARENADEFR
ncbi:MAG: NAD(P)H-binding protein [Polyangiales bacterium]